MDTDDEGDLSAFRKFIDDSLNIAGIGDSPIPKGMSDFTRYNPALGDHKALQRDIRQAWNALHREQPGKTYWGYRLTPLELETQGILQEMILTQLQKRFTGAPTEDDLRSMIAYTMSLSWLILGVLEEKYAPPYDDDVTPSNLTDIEF
jgi:hypothetical protein